MDSKQRADVFMAVHKGLRWGFLGLSLKLDSMDWLDLGSENGVSAKLEKTAP
jgi:hypothetical protein